jgi:hypothetical protein
MNARSGVRTGIVLLTFASTSADAGGFKPLEVSPIVPLDRSEERAQKIDPCEGHPDWYWCSDDEFKHEKTPMPVPEHKT